MALANYGDLKSAIALWLERSDQTSRIPEFIALAESRIYSALRVREMEANANVTVSSATRTSALPTRFAQVRSVYISGSPNVILEYRDPAEYWAIYADLTSAKPQVYTIEGTNFVWGPVPDAAYTAVTQIFQIPAAFSADGDTNSVFARWPDLYLFAALLEAAMFLEDDIAAIKWSTRWDDALEKAQATDARDRLPG